MGRAKQEILQLLDKYTLGICSQEEQSKLFAYIASGKFDALVKTHIQQSLEKESSFKEHELSEKKGNAIAEKILTYGEKTLTIGNTEEDHEAIKKVPKFEVFKWLSAASVLAIICISAWFFSNGNDKNLLTDASSLHLKNIQTIYNDSHNAMLVSLEDGSKITLQPGAKLLYPETFQDIKERDVYLIGDAFFDIAKDAKHPFVVFHKNLITKVLGTKFYVKQDGKNNQSEVEVRSGKVEVFENIKLLRKRIHLNDGAIITPNQKVVYAEDKRMFSTTLVNEPLPTVEKDVDGNEIQYDTRQFEFRSASLKKIVPIIEKFYGIRLEVENEALYNCLFTGDISTENLFTKMDVLCSTLGATYEIKGINILIKGNGCSPN